MCRVGLPPLRLVRLVVVARPRKPFSLFFAPAYSASPSPAGVCLRDSDRRRRRRCPGPPRRNSGTSLLPKTNAECSVSLSRTPSHPFDPPSPAYTCQGSSNNSKLRACARSCPRHTHTHTCVRIYVAAALLRSVSACGTTACTARPTARPPTRSRFLRANPPP